MDFAELYKTDVKKHITKKGKFNYLSWPYAVSEFRKACPNGTWHIRHFLEDPYCQSDAGCFVEVSVCPDVSSPQVAFTQIHPVLDYKNSTIKEPNAFQINTSIQRCLVKAIALATGIGLHIYAGEDLPEDDKKKEDVKIDVEREKRNAEADIKGWKTLCDKASKKGIEEFRDWYSANEKYILSDCGVEGLQDVYNHWIAVGKKLTVKEGK